MASWDEISNSDQFKALTPDQQAQVKTQFESSNPTPKQSSPDWNTIANSKQYQSLSDENKQAVQKQYQDNGGVINSGSGSLLTDIGNTVNAGLASFGQTLSNADKGAGELATKGAKFFGASDETANKIGQYVSGEKQVVNDLTGQNIVATKPETETEYKNNLDNARNTAAGRFAGKYGSTAGDIAVMAVAPEFAPAIMAGKETASAYADQSPENKSLLKAGVSGIATYAANKALPLAGGKIVSQTLGRVLGDGVSEAATNLVSKAIGQRAATGVVKAVTEAGKNAVAGAIGGAPAGAASAYARGGDVLQGAKEGAETGAIFGAGSSAVHTVGSGITNAIPWKAPVSKVSPKVNEAIDKESDAVNNASSHEERDQALADAKHANITTGLNVASEHGLDMHSQAVAGNAAGEAVLGVKSKSTTAKLKDPRQVIKDSKEALKSFNEDVKGSKVTNDALFNRIKSESAETELDLPSNRQTKAENTAAVKSIQDNLNTVDKLTKLGKFQEARKYAIEAQKSFDSAPEHIQEAIQNGYQAPKGFTEGFDPVAHVHQMEATNSVFGKTLEAATKNPAGKGIQLPLYAHLALEHVLPGYGLASHTVNTLLTGASKARQAAQARTNAEVLSNVNKPTVAAKNAPKAPDVDWNQFSAKHNTRWMESKVNQIKETFSDPKLADKITVDNVANESYVKGLMAQDRAANRELQTKHIETVATRKAIRQQAQQEKAQDQVDEYFNNAGSYHDKGVKAQAIANTTKGGKLLNADRVIAEAQKITGNRAKAGTAEEFKSYIDSKSVNVSPEAKAGMKSEVDKFFKGGKRLDAEQQKDLWKQIGDWESQIHTDNRSNAFAEAATTNAAKNISKVEKRAQAERKATQVNDTAKAMEAELKNSGLSESDISDFINNHTDKVYSKAKTESQHNTAKDKAVEAAREYAKAHQEMNVAQREEKVSGVSDDELKDIAEKLANNKPLEGDEADHVQSGLFNQINGKIKASENGKVKVKDSSIESEMNTAREKAKHFFKDNPKRLHATLRSIDVMEAGLKARASNPGAHWSTWINKTQLNSIEGANSYGLLSRVVDTVTGKNYDQPNVRQAFEGSEAEPTAALKQSKAKGNAVKAYRIRKASRKTTASK
ncbi:hypothetical protein P9477_23235 [Enterobacter mori]|uniref:hypothetical protein n=1 Tax=Enterobacter mori TaxID=539813 RepID=UPI00398B732D